MKLRIKLVFGAIATMLVATGSFGFATPSAHASGGAWYITYSGGRITGPISCTPVRSFDPLVAYVGPMTGIWNACGDRIWVHEYADWGNNNGWAICVSPGHVQPLIGYYAYSTEVYVSNNPAPC